METTKIYVVTWEGEYGLDATSHRTLDSALAEFERIKGIIGPNDEAVEDTYFCHDGENTVNVHVTDLKD